MTPGLFEHALFAAITLLLPLWALRQHRALVADIESGRPAARVNAYRRTMAVEWGFAIVVVAHWASSGRLPGVLGVGDTSVVWWWIGAALAVIGSSLLLAQTLVILRSSERMAQVRAQLAPLRSIIPGNAREGRYFAGLSVTAGVCEEIVYRGFLIVYLAALFPLWFAVVLSSVIFGVGHTYQGGGGILKTGLVGLIMAGLFLLTGALWAPMLLHAVIDLNSGYLGRKVLGA
jgi:CAAX protease family protein